MILDNELFITEQARVDLLISLIDPPRPEQFAVYGFLGVAMCAGVLAGRIAQFNARWRHDPVLRAMWMML